MLKNPDEKINKGVIMTKDTILIVKREAKRSKRSFSSQIAFIVEQWIRQENKRKNSELKNEQQ